MSETISTLVRAEGRPAPKGSRIAARSVNGNSYTFPASKYEKPWVEAVRDATRQALIHQPTPAPPYEVDIEVVLPARVRPRKTALPYPTGADLDKLLRAIIDGLVNGGVMTDDRHLVRVSGTKRFAQNGEPAGMRALVRGPAKI